MPVDKDTIPVGLEKDRIILYRLPPRERPIAPNKNWRGRIVHVYSSTHNDVGAVMVSSLEPVVEELTVRHEQHFIHYTDVERVKS